MATDNRYVIELDNAFIVIDPQKNADPVPKGWLVVAKSGASTDDIMGGSSSGTVLLTGDTISLMGVATTDDTGYAWGLFETDNTVRLLDSKSGSSRTGVRKSISATNSVDQYFASNRKKTASKK